MIDFTGVKAITIPEGSVKKITANGVTLWEKISFVNQIPLSITSSKTPYVGDNGEDGFRANYALNASANEVSKAGFGVTGFIPAKRGDTIYFRNINTDTNGDADSGNNIKINLYTSSFTGTRGDVFKNIVTNSNLSYVYSNITVDSLGYITSFTLEDQYNNLITDAGGYIRISAEMLTENSIISINQPIVGELPYTNVLPTAIGSDGKPFNGGKGWKDGVRLNSSGAEVSQSDMKATGFIPVTRNDSVFFSGVTMPYDGAKVSQQYFTLYDSNFNKLTYVTINSSSTLFGMRKYYSDHNLATVCIEHMLTYYGQSEENRNKVAYFRFSAPGIDENSIVTVNQHLHKE